MSGTKLIANLCDTLRQEFLQQNKSKRHLEDVLKVVQKKVNLKISWVKVTEDEKSDERINRTFKERQRRTGDGQIEWIQCRPVQQTIDCRSTLWDFIRFESPSRKRFTETQTEPNES